MNTTTTKLHSLTFGNVKTYLFSVLFVAGNILLPQLCHLLPMGGPTLLPIYFFTLIAAYKFGIRVGLLTAVLSPVVNHLLFAMPAAAVLPAILIKSVLLAVAVMKRSSSVIRLPATWLREDEACPPLELPDWSGGKTLIWMALEKTFSPSTSILAAGMVYVPSLPAIKIYVNVMERLEDTFPFMI